MGPTPKVLADVDERLVKLHNRHGRKVSLLGWSAGGQYARYLARRRPDMVRQVITLGTPLQLHPRDRSSMSFIADRLEHRFDPDFRRLTEHERGRLPVPSTAIYSRTDGVVRWEACIDDVDEQHENVEVKGTHSGMGFNPAALFVVADRLQQAEDDWRPFHAPVWLRSLFPRPESWQHLHPDTVDAVGTSVPPTKSDYPDPIERLRAIAAQQRSNPADP
jgi:pimeloyl-ACP methyl ester carboxylesterase